jgi:hypothetical protein
MPGSPCSRLLARGGLACSGAGNKREETHVATYSSRGVGLHARRQGESKLDSLLKYACLPGQGLDVGTGWSVALCSPGLFPQEAPL